MTRHTENSNLTLHYHTHFQDLAIQTTPGPLAAEYLERLRQVVENALCEHGRVFAFRLDLRFPAEHAFRYASNNQVIERFIGSFKAKIKHNRQKAHEANRYAHDTTVRYVWAREIGRQGDPHYHLAILLNHDAFCTLGQFEIGRNNLFNRLHEAWATALGLTLEAVVGLVEIPDNHGYSLNRHDQQSKAAFFYRASYLCKVATKHYGDGIHSFGASHR